MIERYLKQFSYFPQKIAIEPADSLSIIIVIPARREADLILTLESIYAATPPENPFEVIVVFNHPENEESHLKEENYSFLRLCEDWIQKKSNKTTHIIEAFDLPKKHAGVGLARKIGMDEALRRLDGNGVIVGLDADCTVANNYLISIEDFFFQHKKCNAASIYFEHNIESSDTSLNDGIIQYELHLRYYNQLLKYAGHPFAFHTVGSSMAVRASAYLKQGGMNKRKAGEDFYFLQKIIQLGNFGEINATCVYPSARVSDRVPFGTGRAQSEWKKENRQELESYHPEVGELLKQFFSNVENEALNLEFSSFPKSVQDFIGEDQWTSKHNELLSNTSSKNAYIQRFYQWFNLFMCFKYVHFYRDNIKKNIAIKDAASQLLNKIRGGSEEYDSVLELLYKFREIES